METDRPSQRRTLASDLWDHFGLRIFVAVLNSLLYTASMLNAQAWLLAHLSGTGRDKELVACTDDIASSRFDSV